MPPVNDSSTSDHFSLFSKNSNSIAAEILLDIIPIAEAVQMFVLGPRLILSIRDHQAKLVTNSDEGTAMTTIAFQERVQVSTGGSV